MEDVKVSIIVPVYNAEKYLAECLNSLVNQSLQEIEIICIDDGSSDQSYEIVNRYSQMDTRVILMKNPSNMGQPTSRNRGIERATGKYIQFVDADDFIEINAAKELFEYAEEKHSDMCYMGMQVHFEGELDVKAVPDTILCTYPDIYDGRELLGEFVRNKEFFYYTWSVFYRSEFLKKNNLFYRELVCGQGGNFIPRCLCNAKKVVINPSKLYHYRVHNESITHTQKAQKELLMGKIMRYIDILQYFARDVHSKNLESFLDETYRKLIGGIQSLTYNEKIELENRMDSCFEKHIFRVLCKEGQNYNVHLSDELVAKIKEKKHVIIYGAGYATRDMVEQLNKHEIEIIGFAITVRKGNKSCLFGHHIYEIHELKEYANTAIVLVSANKKYNEEIGDILEKQGFSEYIFLDIEI